MQRLLGPRLYSPSTSSEVDTPEALASCKYVVLYFGAGWCGNCKPFAVELKNLHALLDKKRDDVKFVYVSCDRSEEGFLDTVKDAPWWAVPYRQRRAKLRLSRKFRALGIPSCLIVERETAAVVCADVREELSRDGEAEKFPWGGKTLWGILEHSAIQSRSGELISVKSLRERHDGVALYFGASWCGPCRLFSPRLASVYQKLRDGRTSTEFIFVSADKTEGEFEEYRATMPWASLPWHDAATAALRRLLHVQALPALVTVRPDGTTVNADAHCDASSDPTGAGYPWAREELPFVSPLVASEEVVEALTTATCFILSRNGAGNFDVPAAEFTAAAKRMKAARCATQAVANDGDDDDEVVHFFISDDTSDVIDRVFEAFALPRQTNGQSLVLAVSMAHDRKKELFIKDISCDMVVSFVERYLSAIALPPEQ